MSLNIYWIKNMFKNLAKNVYCIQKFYAQYPSLSLPVT